MDGSSFAWQTGGPVLLNHAAKGSDVSEPHITVNGCPRALAGTPAHTNALDFLRGLGITGA